MTQLTDFRGLVHVRNLFLRSPCKLKFQLEKHPKTRQRQKLPPEADNELALETLLPGFGHDLSLHLGNSLVLFQIFRLKVGCPGQRYRVQGSYNEDSMCSMQAMHGV